MQQRQQQQQEQQQTTMRNYKHDQHVPDTTSSLTFATMLAHVRVSKTDEEEAIEDVEGIKVDDAVNRAYLRSAVKIMYLYSLLPEHLKREFCGNDIYLSLNGSKTLEDLAHKVKYLVYVGRQWKLGRALIDGRPVEEVEMLLTTGADPNDTAHGDHFLALAVKQNRLDLVHALTRHGASVTLESYALQEAVIQRHVPILRHLLRVADGCTPAVLNDLLLLAVRMNDGLDSHLDVVSALIDAGADDSDGKVSRLVEEDPDRKYSRALSEMLTHLRLRVLLADL